MDPTAAAALRAALSGVWLREHCESTVITSHDTQATTLEDAQSTVLGTLRDVNVSQQQVGT